MVEKTPHQAAQESLPEVPLELPLSPNEKEVVDLIASGRISNCLAGLSLMERKIASSRDGEVDTRIGGEIVLMSIDEYREYWNKDTLRVLFMPDQGVSMRVTGEDGEVSEIHVLDVREPMIEHLRQGVFDRCIRLLNMLIELTKRDSLFEEGEDRQAIPASIRAVMREKEKLFEDCGLT